MAVAGVVLAAALAACGDSEPASVAPPTTPKDEYIRRADAICTGIRRRLGPLLTEKANDFRAIYRNATARGNLHQEKLILLRDIDDPDRDADALERYLNDVEAVAIAERKVAASAVTRNLDVVRGEEKARDQAADRESARARTFGFRVCGTETVAR
jgi:hypothetical protein